MGKQQCVLFQSKDQAKSVLIAYCYARSAMQGDEKRLWICDCSKSDWHLPGLKQDVLLLYRLEYAKPEFCRWLLGAIKNTTKQVRVIATTACNLEMLSDCSLFDEELFAAISKYIISLEEGSMTESFGELVHEIIEGASIKYSKNIQKIDLQFAEFVECTAWTNGLTELQQFIEKNVRTTRGTTLTLVSEKKKRRFKSPQTAFAQDSSKISPQSQRKYGANGLLAAQ